jgi:hypothetical protein
MGMILSFREGGMDDCCGGVNHWRLSVSGDQDMLRHELLDQKSIYSTTKQRTIKKHVHANPHNFCKMPVHKDKDQYLLCNAGRRIPHLATLRANSRSSKL